MPGAGPIVAGIETATPLGAVALVSRGAVEGEISLRSPESHSERVLPALERLLGLLGLPLGAIGAVAVSSGPGSFTGLRTGVAAAKGLAFALGVPLYGVPTLDALAAGAPPADRPVCALINARRGELFRAFYRVTPAGAARVGDEHLVPVARLRETLPPGCLLVGEVPAPLREEALAAAGAPFSVAPEALGHPRASTVARAGLDRLLRGEDSELDRLHPRYVRPPDVGDPVPRICQR